jgi:hypothetical protein
MSKPEFKNDRLVLLLFALVSAILYCCLLPLWEGFDEPFHYGYVQSLSLDHRIPVVDKTRISSEIRQSLALMPVSSILHRSLPNSIAFADWFHLSYQERDARRKALSALPLRLSTQSSDLANYEAQQAPLAYVLLVPVNAVLSSLQLPRRILLLRLCVAVSSALLLFVAANQLATALGLERPFRLLALTCIFESQMLWAATAHVGNDWVAIPFATALIAYLAFVARHHKHRDLMIAGLLLAAGLLTKSYFLAFVPVFFALLVYQYARSYIALRTLGIAACVPMVIAAPWYIRNVLLYGTVSGMQENIRGIGLHRAFEALSQINWLTSFGDLARWSLWTGNWSFVAFSRSTLNFEIFLLVASLVLLLARRKQITTGEVWVFAALASFGLGLVYYTCVAWADTRGAATNAMPWYAQCVMPAIWILAALGMQRSGMAGRVIAGCTCLVAAWIAALTYLAKLFPLYGGYEGRANLPGIWNWWTGTPGTLLSSVTLVPVSVLFVLLSIFLFLLVAVNTSVLKRFVSPSQESACECEHRS